jgi:hypothetical protein
MSPANTSIGSSYCFPAVVSHGVPLGCGVPISRYCLPHLLTVRLSQRGICQQQDNSKANQQPDHLDCFLPECTPSGRSSSSALRKESRSSKLILLRICSLPGPPRFRKIGPVHSSTRNARNALSRSTKTPRAGILVPPPRPRISDHGMLVIARTAYPGRADTLGLSSGTVLVFQQTRSPSRRARYGTYGRTGKEHS